MHLFGGSVRQIPEGPEAVLDQSLAGVRQVETQGLHASWTEIGEKESHFRFNPSFIKPILSDLNQKAGDRNTPASTMAGLLLEQTDRTLRTRLVVHKSFS